MNELFKRKLENVQSQLMEKHRDSSHYSSPITGAEREAVKKELLSLILPPGYRIGSGTIIDASKRETGQVDAVIEQPFSLSFPIATDTNRLYLADTVGAAFEVKSNLNTQGSDALKKIEEIRSLTRHSTHGEEIIQYGLLHIPSFIVAYTGPKTTEKLEEKYLKPRDKFYPNGVLVIESEIFCGWSASGDWHSGKGKAGCIFSFLSCILQSLSFTAGNRVDLFRYSSLLNRSNTEG